jgi:hypothetical protein
MERKKVGFGRFFRGFGGFSGVLGDWKGRCRPDAESVDKGIMISALQFLLRSIGEI